MSKDSMRKNNGNQNFSSAPNLSFVSENDVVTCHFSGNWTIYELSDLSSFHEKWDVFLGNLDKINSIVIKVADGVIWDSSLVCFLVSKINVLVGKDIPVVQDFTSSLKKLVSLGLDRSKQVSKEQLVYSENSSILTLLWQRISTPLNFIGAWMISILAIPLLRTQMRLKDLVSACRQCGASALPIVTLISFLTGLTMAFVGSVQLEKFNAKIYIADLVCLAMVREMGALMVGIVMAGRTGASFAAELGNMKLNEELDSLRTFGIGPMDFLVLPRTLALLIMTPMLVIYADIIGMLGGLTVGVQVMDFSMSHYIEQTQSSISSMWEVFSGLLKSLAFGLIIGLVGCFKGLHTGHTSSALGRSVTSAVVVSITLIVVADALFEIVFSALELR